MNSHRYLDKLVWAVVIFGVLGCGGASVPAKQSAESGKTHEEGDSYEVEGPIRWFHDDYTAALGEAKQKKIPLVIDVWAPWCHTCLSMKHYVLKDPSMAAFADRFVWLALDTDKPSAAAVLEKFPVRAWPTFFVISPLDESVQARFQGSATLDQFRGFLAQGEKGHLDASAKEGALKPDDPLFLVRQGDRAALSGDLSGAEEAWTAALEKAAPDWERRPDVLVSRISALFHGEKWSACVDLGDAAMDQTGNSARASDFLIYATMCARSLDQNDEDIRAFYHRAVKRLEDLDSNPQAPLSYDDRSDGLHILRDIHEALGDKDAAHAAAERQRALLDEAAKNARSAEAAATYNWPRAEVYVFLGRGADLIPSLAASAEALPDDYDPPYRLAWVALKEGDLERALGAANQALRLVYGPRKGRVLELVAEIQKARGDRQAECAAWQEAVKLYESLPDGHKRPDALERARQSLEREREQ